MEEGGSGGPGTTKQPPAHLHLPSLPGGSPGSEPGFASPCIEASSPGPLDHELPEDTEERP